MKNPAAAMGAVAEVHQASLMSFADVFLVLTVLFVALAALGVIMKKPALPRPGAAGH